VRVKLDENIPTAAATVALDLGLDADRSSVRTGRSKR